MRELMEKAGLYKPHKTDPGNFSFRAREEKQVLSLLGLAWVDGDRKVHVTRVGENRKCVDCGCAIYVRKRDIYSLTAGQRCRACQRKKSPLLAREIKQTATTKTTECDTCGYFGDEKLNGEKPFCPKCGVGILQPFTYQETENFYGF